LLDSRTSVDQTAPVCRFNSQTESFDLHCADTIVVPGVTNAVTEGGIDAALSKCEKEVNTIDKTSKHSKYGSCAHLLKCQLDETLNPRGINLCASKDDCRGHRNCIDGTCAGESGCFDDGAQQTILSNVYTMQSADSRKFPTGSAEVNRCDPSDSSFRSGKCRWKFSNIRRNNYTIQHVDDKKFLWHADSGNVSFVNADKCKNNSGIVPDNCLFQVDAVPNDRNVYSIAYGSQQAQYSLTNRNGKFIAGKGACSDDACKFGLKHR
jgi:hypothetical protein